MMVLADRANRRFLTGMLLFAVGLIIGALALSVCQAQADWQLLQAQEARVASALLADGVARTTVAEAFSDTAAVTAEGQALLTQIGHGDDVPFFYFASLRDRALETGAVALLAAVILGALLLFWSWCFLKQRERCYEAAAETIAAYADGQFDAHLPQNESGALYQLFGAVEEMALSLQAKSDNEQRVKTFLKTMISDISHQVKTPLAALRMYNEIIAGEPENTDVVRIFSEKSTAALDRLEALIQSLLKVTRLDAGSVTFKRMPQKVTTLLSNAMEPFQTRAVQEGKTLRLEGDASAVCVCDLTWTGEAVGNLIKNALDHTPYGGHVVVSWTASPALIQIRVSDDGAGIAPEDLHHIFKRFYRSAHADSQQGVGLGLPIAKAIVEGQNGSLSVASAPGQGTVFTMSFPAFAQAADAELTKL